MCNTNFLYIEQYLSVYNNIFMHVHRGTYIISQYKSTFLRPIDNSILCLLISNYNYIIYNYNYIIYNYI